jgi:glutamate synthase domain-containing protein 3
VGIATQDPELRKRFTGKPEHVINFMFYIAEELREIMAELGFRTVNEMIGRTDMLEFADVSNHVKARHLNLSVILHRPDLQMGKQVPLHHCETQNHGLEKAMDNQLIKLAQPAIQNGKKVRYELSIRNVNRTVGATLSGEIAKKYGFAGLPNDTITFKFHGSAGQSFGCFLAKGVTLILEGDANDYLAKGLSGGKIIVHPHRAALDTGFKAEHNIIAGNVVCYGAVEGEVYIRGVVGERFCVRNSGAHAIVEGVGDHGCEYMTGGRVVVIGPTGRNFAAGMSGGIAYVYDEDGTFRYRCNQDMVTLESLFDPEDIQLIRRMIENHLKYTHSPVAKAILSDWGNELRRFVKVMPNDYRRVLENMAAIEERAKKLAQIQTANA